MATRYCPRCGDWRVAAAVSYTNSTGGRIVEHTCLACARKLKRQEGKKVRVTVFNLEAQ